MKTPQFFSNEVVWNLEGGQAFCKYLNEYLEDLGWCAGLTGSVLFNRESTKDLDVILYPRGNPKAITKPSLKLALEGYGMTCRLDEAATKQMWLDVHDSRDTKHVEIWEYDSRRVDLFFLS